MKFKNKKVLVYGMSKSGDWATRLLLKLKANVFLYDDDLTKLRLHRLKNCFILQELNESIIKDLDAIIVSPAIEKDNKYLCFAEAYNKLVMSEMEFASLFAGEIVAVTGTNGKTTTVRLIEAILNQKRKAIACGNIGLPVSRAVLECKKDLKVVEVSSFMLEHAKTFSPHVATVLNIQPDHLVRHKTMAEYTKLKLNIFENLKPTDYAVIDLDSNIHSTKNCKKVTYSYRHIADVYYSKGSIYLHQQKVIDVNQLRLKGQHNIMNVMCAICYGYIYKIPLQDIKSALLNFYPSEFRNTVLESVNEIGFINDSKSTNIASTLASVNATNSAVILILAGSKKGLDYTQLFEKLSKRVKQIVVFGEIAEEICQVNTNFKISKFSTLKPAFDYAVSQALPGDTILFSPSSASYDLYENYLERGKEFNKLVSEYAQTKME